MMVGVENIKKLLDVGLEAGNVIDKISKGTSASKWTAVFMLADEVEAAFGIDLNMAKQEFLDLDDAEKADLKAHVAAKLDLADDKLEKAVEDGFNLGIKVYEVGTELYEFIDSLKK